MPILFAVAGSALGCFAEGAILGASVYLVSRGVRNPLKIKMIRRMGKGHGADSKPHISAALSSRPFPTSLRDFPIPPPRKSIDIPAAVTRQDFVSL